MELTWQTGPRARALAEGRGGRAARQEPDVHETRGELPEIEVTVTDHAIVVRDKGAGLPADVV
jgi:hypothetical protein